ncbi:mitochondrial uncoupling protein 3 isoform X2 [Pyrus x bretschneideri]|uniref:mitochondrial uncoupling protein 3 isoform X2 n=1 Tax=Pyrus x bretschneideri TaxID=225117 RepID=UPI00202F781D|nr:mitochondrial uncoupling protein 3 isoform X2 [Pyrus x bretschneideri]
MKSNPPLQKPRKLETGNPPIYTLQRVQMVNKRHTEHAVVYGKGCRLQRLDYSNFTDSISKLLLVDDETERRPRSVQEDITGVGLGHGGGDDNISGRPDEDEASAARRVGVGWVNPAYQRVPGRLGNRAGARSGGIVQGLVTGDSQTPLLHADSDRRVRAAQKLAEERRWVPLSPRQSSLRWNLRRRCSVQLVASPADLVKVRMQADGRTVAQGIQPRYSGCFNALNKIVRAEGVGGLWKGVFPNVQRAFLVNMGELACYDQAKRFVIENRISEDNIYAHTLASIMSGLSATALSCPADVVKTRMMNQSRSKEGKIMYNNSYDCLVKTVKVEGLRALWKGFFPTWARLGPWQFVFWVSYEKFRQIAGFSSF